MYRFGGLLVHLGWAIWGQQCHCGSNPFNVLARVMRYVGIESDYEEETGMLHVRGACVWHAGNLFYTLGMWLDPELRSM